MKTRIAAVVTAFVLGVAPISSAMAFSANSPANPFAPRDVETTGSIGAIGSANTSVPFYGACPMSSASEGNANQQNFAVKQYGQTSGGHRC